MFLLSPSYCLRAALVAMGSYMVVTSWPVSAQPSIDCAKAESTAEKLVCEDTALAEIDQRLAARFSAALETVRSMDARADSAEAELRARQRGWIKGRDDCWKADDQRACVKASYLTREANLVALRRLEEPSATAYWTCDDRAEIVTLFFDTALPAVRLEIGDSVRSAHLVRAASGSKYAGEFGEEIWLKGEEAFYRAPDPDGTKKTCALRSNE